MVLNFQVHTSMPFQGLNIFKQEIPFMSFHYIIKQLSPTSLSFTFPVLIPRNFATIIDEKSMSQFSKFGFDTNDLFRETDILIKEFITKNASASLSLKEQEAELINTFNQISAKAVSVDATLQNTVEAEMQKSMNSIKNIEMKLMRAEKQKQETSVNQIKKIKEKYFPEGVLQERYDNFIPYYLKSGINFIPDLKDTLVPFDFDMHILV